MGNGNYSLSNPETAFEHPNGLLMYQHLPDKQPERKCAFCDSAIDEELAEEIETLGHLEIYREFLDWLRAPEKYKNHYFLVRKREEEVYEHIPHGVQEDWDDDYKPLIFEHVYSLNSNNEYALNQRAEAEIYSSIWHTLSRQKLAKFELFLGAVYAHIAPEYVIRKPKWT